MPSKYLSLARLLPDIQPRRFLSEHWPDKFFVSRGAVARLRDVADLPELRDLQAVARCFGDGVRVWSPTGELLRLEPSKALALCRAGWLFHAVGVERFVPKLSLHLRRLEQELGMPIGSGRCAIFASRRGAGALPHVDSDISFNLQLRGRKRWTALPRRAVAGPGAAQPRQRAWAAGVTCVLSPGDVAFVPNSCWHTTKCLDDSLALDFEFVPRSWGEVVLSTLRKRLLEREAWRKSAIDLSSMGSSRRHLEKLLADLPGEMETLEADVARELEHLPPAIDRRWRFVPCEAGRVSVTKRLKPTPCWMLEFRSRVRHGCETEIEADLVPLCRWLSRRERAFSGCEAVRNGLPLCGESVARVLATFVKMGALARRRAE